LKLHEESRVEENQIAKTQRVIETVDGLSNELEGGSGRSSQLTGKRSHALFFFKTEISQSGSFVNVDTIINFVLIPALH